MQHTEISGPDLSYTLWWGRSRYPSRLCGHLKQCRTPRTTSLEMVVSLFVISASAWKQPCFFFTTQTYSCLLKHMIVLILKKRKKRKRNPTKMIVIHFTICTELHVAVPPRLGNCSQWFGSWSYLCTVFLHMSAEWFKGFIFSSF